MIKGLNIKSLRLSTNTSRTLCADKLGITPTYLCLIERGKKRPSDKIVAKAKQLFRTTDSDIRTFTEGTKKTLESISHLNHRDQIVCLGALEILIASNGKVTPELIKQVIK